MTKLTPKQPPNLPPTNTATFTPIITRQEIEENFEDISSITIPPLTQENDFDRRVKTLAAENDDKATNLPRAVGKMLRDTVDRVRGKAEQQEDLKNPQLFYETGVIHTRLNQDQEALDSIDEAIRLKTENLSNLYLTKAKIHVRLGGKENDQKAIDTFNKVMNSKDALLEKGMAYEELGNDQQALEDFDGVQEFGIITEELFYQRSLVNYNLENYREALSDAYQYLEKKMGKSQTMLTPIGAGVLIGLALASACIALIAMRQQEQNPAQQQLVLVQNDEETSRTTIKTTIIPGMLSFYIEDHALSEDEKSMMQKLPADIAGEIFDKISGYDEPSAISQFITEKLQNIESLDDAEKKQLLETFKEINSQIAAARIIQHSNTNPIYLYNIIHNTGYQENPSQAFLVTVYLQLIKIFDEEVPKYLKAKHQELIAKPSTDVESPTLRQRFGSVEQGGSTGH